MTSKIDQKVIDNDSFSIVKDYVKNMEEYDNLEKIKYKTIFTRIILDLEYIFDNLKEVRNIEPRAKEILEEVDYFNREESSVMELDDLNDLEFARLNGHYDDEDEYTEDYYDDRDPFDDDYGNGFLGWFNGASCDI